MTTRSEPSRRNAKRGFTLLEVLISLLILAIGLLGIAGLQARGLRFNHDAYIRTQATILAYDMIDRIRANRGNAANYMAAPVATDVCNQTSGAINIELRCWHQDVADLLPEGTGTIAANGTDARFLDVTLSWRDRQTGAAKTQTWTVLP